MSNIDDASLKALYEQIRKVAESGGYHINPDNSFTMSLIEGLAVNEQRYGYQACPCRLASGDHEKDMDLICPCDYRDPDLSEYGMCYCALYVSGDVMNGLKELTSIPDRRGIQIRSSKETSIPPVESKNLAYPVWRCKVCGYLCARTDAPEVCPICKVKKERFERFI